MEYEKFPYLYWRAVLMTLALSMTGSRSHGALCPAACRCDNDALKTSCAAASLEFVPIQLNPELRELDISHNRIVHIHFSFPFYEELIALDLSHNRIKTLGNSNFNSQKNLTHLNLRGNSIENLTKDSFKGLKALARLDLSNNSLSEIQEMAFRDLHSLAIVKLSSNRLIHLDAGLFRSGKNLRELYLDDNQFVEVPVDSLIDVVHLNYLSLSRNYISNVKMPVLPELRTLLLDQNVISDINTGGLSTLTALLNLDLSNNNLTVMPTESLSKLSNLTTLKLSGNLISVLQPIAFRGLFNLKVLEIDRIATLSQIDVRTFVDNINLEKVYMDYNMGIKSLPTRLFHGNSKLTYITIRYNSLRALEAGHFPLDQLRELRLGGNPLQCNCSLGWLWQLVVASRESRPLNASSSKDLVLDDSDITCASPEDLRSKRLSAATGGQMSCSVGWIAALSVAVTVAFILAVIGGVVYWAPRRRPGAQRDEKRAGRSPAEASSARGEPAQIEKYILQPSIMMHNEYRTLTPWDPYGASVVNIYEQINDNRERPHIVYV